MIKRIIKKIFKKRGYNIVYKGSVEFGKGTSSDAIETLDFSQIIFDNQEAALKIITIASKYSMCSIERMFTLFNLVKYLETEKILGDFVECGVWKGGNIGIMAYVNKTYGSIQSRNLWMYDTFEGLPSPNAEDGTEALEYYRTAKNNEDSRSLCVADESFVIELLDKIEFPKELRRIEKGLFQTTLLKNKPNTIALLRLDGDWYDSTKICLEELYDKVVDKGIIIIDDYGAWSGCKKAVDEFFQKIGATPFLHHVDFTCRYIIKNG